MAKQYKSEALAAARETAQGLADAGVMAKRTMKAFDEMCLTPVEEIVTNARGGDNARKGSRAPAAEEREPSGVRAPSERDHGPGEPMGTGRETARR